MRATGEALYVCVIGGCRGIIIVVNVTGPSWKRPLQAAQPGAGDLWSSGHQACCSCPSGCPHLHKAAGNGCNSVGCCTPWAGALLLQAGLLLSAGPCHFKCCCAVPQLWRRSWQRQPMGPLPRASARRRVLPGWLARRTARRVRHVLGGLCVHHSAHLVVHFCCRQTQVETDSASLRPLE